METVMPPSASRARSWCTSASGKRTGCFRLATSMTMTVVLVIAAAYLLGSIPFSFLVARARGVDVRKVGSGNVGATNVVRSAGMGAGLLALLLDAVKGTAAVLLAAWLAPPHAAEVLPAAAATAAVLGHV